ncbi:MAG: sensor histidine kinase [Steroidobacteraceae bacterium]
MHPVGQQSAWPTGQLLLELLQLKRARYTRLSMQITTRRNAIAFFIVLCSTLVAIAVGLNIYWIIQWRSVVSLVVGIVLFALIIAGLILNTIFLVREIRRNEQHDSFINAVTHELKTPIASLRLYLETLQSRDVTEVQRQDFYRVMHKDTDRLSATVEQVLRAAEVVQSLKHRDWAPVNMQTLLQECVELARQRHQLGSDALVLAPTELPKEMVMVRGDMEELRTAITNLLDNAVKYSPDGVHITTEVFASGDEVLVRVSDHGVGIPPNDLQRIFKRFFRTGRARNKVKGTGLGLFIVKSIAKKHRGNVTADSAGEGKGATLTLRVPRAGV